MTFPRQRRFDVVEIAASVSERRRSAVEVLDECLESIARSDSEVNAFVEIDEAGARAQADAIDAGIAQGGAPGPLAGVPIGVKDLQDARGLPTRHGSLLYRDAPPAQTDAPLVARLRKAGAVIVGKTACAEFGMSSATSTRLSGVTRNPLAPWATPGGSSGGSAAAVAAGDVPLATSTDTGGSTRSPAALCGLVGLCPSHGLVPSAEPTDLLSEFAIVRRVTDAAVVLDAVAGSPAGERFGLAADPRGYASAIGERPDHSLRLGFSADLGYAAVSRAAVSVAAAAAERLADHLDVEPAAATAPLPNPYLTWITLEGFRLAGDLVRADRWPADAGLLCDDTRRLVELGCAVDAGAHAHARARRRELELEVDAMFGQVDVLITPATADAAFPAEGPVPAAIEGRETELIGFEPFSMFVNLTGNAAITVPAGRADDGRPLGVQLIAPRGQDRLLLQLAAVLEELSGSPSG